MNEVGDVAPCKRIKSDSLCKTGHLSVYNLKYEERDLQEIIVDVEVRNYVGKTLVHPFNVHCMVCNQTCSDEASVFTHMNSPRHLVQLQQNKEAIGIISKEFNTFIVCCLSDLIAFVHVYYKAHKLNEIVVASREFIFSENTDHFGGEPETTKKIIVHSPGFIPPIVENTVYFRVIVDREDSKLYYESREARYSHLTGNIVIKGKGSYSPKIAYVYELFTEGVPSSGPLFVDILEWCSENILHSTLVWCSLCTRSLTIQSLSDHLNLEQHLLSQCPFLYALMCHKCETFFLIVYGNKMHHVHTQCAAKKIIRNQINKKFNAIHLMSDVSREAIEIYVNDFIKRNYLRKSDFRYECLLCFSPLVKCFNEFVNHLVDSSHLDKVAHEGRKFVAFCDACNIILIAQQVNRLFDHFEVHNYTFEMMQNKESSSSANSTDSNILSVVGGSSQENVRSAGLSRETTILYPKVANFSKTAFQVTNPGVQDDFTITKNLTIDNIEEYIAETFYKIYSDIKKLYFVCLNCSESRIDKTAFYNHLKNRKHLMKVRPFADLTFYVKICDICQLFLLGSHITLVEKHFVSSEHSQNIKHKMDFIQGQYKENSEHKVKLGWSGKPTERSREMFSSEDMLNQCVESALKEADDVNNSAIFVHGILEKDIRKSLDPIYGSVDIKIFGSRIYGLAQKNSDVDICLSFGDITIDDLEREFSKSTSLFSVKETIKKAKVPIIKLKHMYTSLQCDINCCDSAAVYNSELIKVYISLDYRVKWVVMAVREWGAANHIRGSKKFTSFGLTWLVLFFLMQPDISLIPPVKLLKELHEGPKTYINGWDYSFTRNIESIKLHHNPLACTKNKHEILLLFFQYYAMLKGKKVLLHPLTGEVYPRSVLANSDSGFCPELILNVEDSEPVRIGGQYMLLDCFRLRHNVLKSVDENLADHFKLICAKTYEDCCWRV